MVYIFFSYFFFFNDTATTEIYTLSLHDALPIYPPEVDAQVEPLRRDGAFQELHRPHGLAVQIVAGLDRKSTRLNSSHANISYAVFCLKKKKKHTRINKPHKSRSHA